MKFTAKCKYGLQALLEIAYQISLGNKMVKRKVIAERQQIPGSYLENILVLLKRDGLIKSVRGLNGGYYLLKDSKQITLYDVITALEGKLQVEECLNTQSECQYSDNCKIKVVWDELRRLQVKLLKGITLYELLKANSQSIPCFKEKIQKKIKE